jgi:hypothetical protein
MEHRITQIIFAALVALLLLTPMWAKAYTGNDFLEAYKKYEAPGPVGSYEEATGMGRMFGTFFGVADTAVRTKLVCPPEGVSYKQGIDMVAKYLQDTPSNRHRPATEIILGILITAFPCEREPTRADPANRNHL